MNNKLWLALALAVTFVLAVAHRNDFIRFLLGFEVLLTVALLADRAVLRRKITGRLRLPEEIVYRGAPFSVEVALQNTGRLPAPEVRVEVWCRDCFTGKTEGLSGVAMLDGMGRATLRFQLDAAHCGALEFRLRRVTVWDHLGVFSGRCPSLGGEAECSVLPSVPPDTDAAGGGWQRTGEGETSAQRPGDDPGDTYDIRPFRAGDALRRVHWKLSAKTDELMVRDFGEPMEPATRLVLGLRREGETLSRGQWDAFLDRVAQVSAGLLEGGYAHEVIWWDGSGSALRRMPVTGEAERERMLCALLRAATYRGEDIGEQIEGTMEQDGEAGSVIRIDLQSVAHPAGGAER